jgi:hypothetical protein
MKTEELLLWTVGILSYTLPYAMAACWGRVSGDCLGHGPGERESLPVASSAFPKTLLGCQAALNRCNRRPGVILG